MKKRVLIIAEAGVNHNGDINLAKKLIDIARECGADIVKFQTFKPDSLVIKSTKMAEYQKKNIGKEESQKDMLSNLTLSYEDFSELYDYCNQKGIQFLSTPFELESIDFLTPLVKFWKVASGEITNYPYLKKIAQTGKDVILSTGMSDLDEIRAALKLLRENGAGEILLLHCNTQYPTPYEDVNLRAMNVLKREFDVPVGYSDHTKGIEVPVAAVALGAQVIEKHFTLNNNMLGPDHKASLEPDEFKRMVQEIRNIEKALGVEEKKVTESEAPNRAVARKSIVALRAIKKGEIITEESITTKRPGNGISPMCWNKVIGTKAIRDFKEDELIEL